MLNFGGKDLSHFFHEYGRPKTRISAKGNTVPLFPPVIEPMDPFEMNDGGCFWWHDPKFVNGRITVRARSVRIINMLLATTQMMTVCEEDTIKDIQRKYKRYNWHYESYDWKKFDTQRWVYQGLCLDKTLTENGFLYDSLASPPSLWLRYKDDGTIA